MKRLSVIIACSFIPFINSAQDNSNGTIQGDFNLSTQSYYEDPAINAEKVDEFMLMNAYSNIRFNKDNFTAGVRFESYLNVLQGFESNFNGNGIPYRFAQYNVNGLGFTKSSHVFSFWCVCLLYVLLVSL